MCFINYELNKLRRDTSYITHTFLHFLLKNLNHYVIISFITGVLLHLKYPL